MKTAIVTMVEWNRDMAVNIPLIDQQHRTLVQMSNDLCTGCLYDAEIAEAYFSTTARRTVEYLRCHFITEEHLMEASEYPLTGKHRRRHLEYLRELSALVRKFDSGAKRAVPRFACFLRDHVMNHVAVKDKEYGLYVAGRAENGVTLPSSPVRPFYI